MTITKTITIDTNFGNKLAADFIHIDLAPPSGIPESKLNESRFLFATKDGTHQGCPGLFRLDDLARFPFETIMKLPATLAQQSHCMEPDELAWHYFTRYKNVKIDTEFAIYYYKKID